MKDLFVFTADADAEALMRAVLCRPRALGIRAITFDVDRHFGRDSGMFKDGPETIRLKVKKDGYSRLLVLWDHHGSGRERKMPAAAEAEIAARLDGVTWEGRHTALAIVPELEEWLWCCPEAIAKHLAISAEQLGEISASCARKLTCDPQQKPKEMFLEVLYHCQRRGPLFRDYAAIATLAKLDDWQASKSFAHMTQALRTWFA